jgi:hypothetical protein
MRFARARAGRIRADDFAVDPVRSLTGLEAADGCRLALDLSVASPAARD